jgi:hypothetical protein
VSGHEIRDWIALGLAIAVAVERVLERRDRLKQQSRDNEDSRYFRHF